MSDDKSCPCLGDPERRAEVESATKHLSNTVAHVGNTMNLCPTAMIGVLAGIAARLLELDDIRELSDLLKREGESLSQRAYLERTDISEGRLN